jgi:hypothetical protein
MTNGSMARRRGPLDCDSLCRPQLPQKSKPAVLVDHIQFVQEPQRITLRVCQESGERLLGRDRVEGGHAEHLL